ncbi:YceI family protein [Erythrobacter sp. F6033]|uniref:YceI family protein n=1 Tax=Erythrobacter sp. F6033 TaxID=2926401 RepID=UPI001FF30E93|nr:YceI family protein [Erythrobacter sp. F6033]MCK0127746.1 YceI family protein [Erythrobacter sp. F6033]
MRPKHLIFVPLLALAFAGNTSAPRNYSLDPGASELSAKVSFFGLSSKTMTIPKMRGKAVIVPDAPERAAIDVTFDTTSLTAPDETTLKRLRGDKFFWVEKYPTVRFVGKSLTLSSPTRGTVSGNLTARGVTKPQTLDVRFDSDPNKAGAREAVSFTATTTIDRRKYGMKSYQLVVGNNVKIKFRARMTPN